MMNKNKLGFSCFLLLLAIIIIGGFFLTKYMTNNKFVSKSNDSINVVEESIDNRIDKTKDYIYITDEKRLISDITSSVININLPSGLSIQDKLNEANDNKIVYLDELEVEENNEDGDVENTDDAISDENNEDNENSVNDEVLYTNDEGIYSLSYVDYSIIEIDSYVTLIVKAYDYNIVSLASAVKIEVYTFDKNLDKLVEESEILKLYDTSINDIIDKIEEKLTALNVYDDSNLLEETINDFSNYGIYINRVGELEITYVVKSTNGDYYDKLVIS